MVMITVPGVAKETSKILNALIRYTKLRGGVIRQSTVLGDRLMAKSLKSKENKYYMVGRYLQVLVDANPSQMENIKKSVKHLN